MAFKINAPYKFNHVPIYRTLDEEGIMGIATKNGAIRIDKNMTDPAMMKEVIHHELVHLDQFNFESNDTGDFHYDNDYMLFKPKGKKGVVRTKRNSKVDGAPHLAQEKEASNKKIQTKIKNKYNEL